ncbi:DUF992 domain-containing protein [Enterovirga rhinocerotis]|uniref:Uncharacterized protein DUF992 n=1 Tax=Enterovirga rhinocerotis TaxID=1339210 RepID=A0A4R7C8L4_9HYPH|nr:DUF992 domain-containing protein [Enterovirga rhinocerotis]TDR93047.1 uncharacterized protein DUF992 [Enterovirga rhinocerotis]
MRELGLMIALAGLGLVAAGAASAQSVKTGDLRCDVSGGIGAIIGSQQAVNCAFTPSRPGPVQNYTGTITKFGLSIGEISGGVMNWLVYAPSLTTGGDLRGAYVGVSATVAVGRGLGANVLVGGDRNTVSLQPVSVETNTGFNIAAGVAELTLDKAP